MTLELWDISFYLCTSKALIKHIYLCVNIQFKQLKFIYAHYNNSNNVFYHYNISACNWLHNIVQFNENQEISLSAWLLTAPRYLWTAVYLETFRPTHSIWQSLFNNEDNVPYSYTLQSSYHNTTNRILVNYNLSLM